MDNLLILDSGHNEYVQGKQSPDKSLKEWHFNNDMQYKIKKRAEDHRIKVCLTNPNPEKKDEIGLTKRASLANDFYKENSNLNTLFVSIHANAYGSQFNNARGTETYIASNASNNSKYAAKVVNDEIVKVMKSIDFNAKDRGVKVENFTVIYKVITPAILIEYGFYSNLDDLKILKNNKDDLCEATIRAICKYFKVTYKPIIDKIEENPQEVKKMYEYVIVYKGEVDKVSAEILEWGLNDVILIPVEKYKEGLGRQVIVVGGGACEIIKGKKEINGKDRYETVKLALNFLGK